MSIVDKNVNQGRIIRSVVRPKQEHLELLKKCYTALVADLLGKNVCVDHKIKPLSEGMTLCGPAITVFGKDLTVRRAAINLSRPGDILVLASEGYQEIACFGDGTALKMKLKGLEGVVIDGFVRDSAGIKKLNFNTFCIGITPRNYHYPFEQDFGAVNVPIVCGGQIVAPGDVVMGDDDGVIIIPASRVEEISLRAIKILETEKKERNITCFERFEGVEEELENRGFIFE
ncbi:RraA family protein [Microbulbifer sp. ANSA001]|uniref:RraA family protein n=1 Tax=Microbulbifer sp. ANSA001 TaxID=3243358 RepID=UPI00404275A8